MRKKIVTIMLCFSLLFCGCAGLGSDDGKKNNENNDSSVEETNDEADGEAGIDKYKGKSADEIVAMLSLEQKAAQMVQPAIYNTSESDMKKECYGSILSQASIQGYEEWQETVDGFQKSALKSKASIPYIYGQDDVHGVNYCRGAVLFPHNIGLGAANDPELMYQVGLATADEAKLCHMLLNFAPCVAQSVDPRWGRTYESYGSDLDIITSLSTAYTKGLVDGGIIACPKHFIADGNVEYGTGENSDVERLIDRGNSTLTDDEIAELLQVYQSLIDSGAQVIMVSHSSLNGIKMHENAKYIQYLKNEMGFKGFVLSDWNSVQNTSADNYYDQIVNSVNAGIDMLMEVETFDAAKNNIVDAVKNGDISEDRINDAVKRIIQVKLDAGLFDDPMLEKIECKQEETGSKEYRELAERLVEKSLVLLKNNQSVLPLKPGTKIYVTGPAASNEAAQCGGWSAQWNGAEKGQLEGVTTILDGLVDVAEEFGATIITDPDEAEAADVVLLCVGEQSYAEWNGDTEDLELCGELGLSGNLEAIEEAEKLGKPVVACIVAGRQVIIDEFYDKWDSVVMCYLPGSEGKGIANVLFGKTNFSGKLPSPWYSSVEQIGTSKPWLDKGYGLKY